MAGVSRSQREHVEDVGGVDRRAPAAPLGEARVEHGAGVPAASISPRISSSPGASGTDQLPGKLVGLVDAAPLGSLRGPPRAHSSVPSAL